MSLHFGLPPRPLKILPSLHDNRKKVKTKLLAYHLHDPHWHKIKFHIDIESKRSLSFVDSYRHILDQKVLKVNLHVFWVWHRFIVQLFTVLRFIVDRLRIHKDCVVVIESVEPNSLKKSLSLRKDRKVKDTVSEFMVTVDVLYLF